MVSPPRGPALPPPPPTAPPDLRARSREGAGRPWAWLPEIGSTWVTSRRRGQDSRHAPCPRPLPAPPPPPAPGPKRGSPGRGRSGSLSAPLGGGRGWGAVPWAEPGAETGDPPERAQPAPGLGLYKRQLVLSWDACAFSNIPTATLRGQATPTHGCTNPPG